MQYRLSTLFFVFFFVAASLAAFGFPGIFIALALILSALAIARSGNLGSGCVYATLIGLLGVPAALWPAIQNARQAAIESCSTCPVGAINLSLHNYHVAHGHFPPPNRCDNEGKPLWSWRVEMLPCLEYGSIYNQLDFAQPWDSPTNRSVLETMPNGKFFTSRFCTRPKYFNSETCYMAVIGPGTAWRSDGPVARSELPDNGSHTVMLVEVANSGVHWAAPRDLTVDEALEGLKTGEGLRISTELKNKTNVLTADGQIHYLPTRMPFSLWKKLLDGEMAKEELDNLRSSLDPNAPDMVEVSMVPKGFNPGLYAKILFYLVWVVAVVLLFRRAINSRKMLADSRMLQIFERRISHRDSLCLESPISPPELPQSP
jgi:hypothetical protein